MKTGRGKTARFRVVHAPCHGPSLKPAHVRAALRLRPNSVAFSESYGLIPFMRALLLWRCVTGASDRRDARGRVVAHDVAILVHRRHRIVASGSFKAADESSPLKIAPERWVVWVIYRVGGSTGYYVLHVAGHPHAGVANAWASDRAAEFRKQMRATKHLIRRKRRRYPDIRVALTGDLNYPEHAPVRQDSPRDVFADLDLDFDADGVDYVAWSRNLRVVGSATISAARNGQDHPWKVRDLAGRDLHLEAS